VSRDTKLAVIIAAVTAILGVVVWYLHDKTFAVLQPAGPIAAQEKHLLLIAVSLMLLVVVPVFILLATISLRYRVSNTKVDARYTPDWDHHRGYEAIWWGLPLLLIIALSIMTWTSAHQLDPTRPISSSSTPLRIQAVALRWKWLFIYPDLHIATVNYLQFPTNTPLDFQITSDGAMNSFWIPQLGGQIYAMSGMTTQLHLLADRSGSFRGDSANISGKGFAGMNFIAKSTSMADFTGWVTNAQNTAPQLGMASYQALAQPSEYNPPTTYSLQALALYDTIVGKSAGPGSAMSGMNMSSAPYRSTN
jgi:cytochrome o ubiquinol oxidase subunit 2